MFRQKNQSASPFWIDDPFPYGLRRSPRFRFPSVIQKIPTLVIQISILILFIYIAFQNPLFWFIAGFHAIVVSLYLFAWGYSVRYRKTNPTSIQQAARESTGAELIGSAIHTAGHPRLGVDQKVVMALKDSLLSFYSYASPVPLATLDISDIESVEPVVYDDERAPHVGVIDNTAQALQITFLYQGGKCVCSFRRMYKVRAIDWYQALEVARKR